MHAVTSHDTQMKSMHKQAVGERSEAHSILGPHTQIYNLKLVPSNCPRHACLNVCGYCLRSYTDRQTH